MKSSNKNGKSIGLNRIIIILLATVLLLPSLAHATINQINILHPSNGELISKWSDFYFEFNYTGDETTADCSLYLGETSILDDTDKLAQNSSVANNNQTIFSPSQFLKDLKGASKYYFYIECRDSSGPKQSTKYSFNVSSDVLPVAPQLYDLPTYFNEDNQNVCGYGDAKDVTITLYVNGPVYDTYFSAYSDTLIDVGGETFTVSEAASKGARSIIVEDPGNVIDNTFTSYYVELKDHPGNCFIYYDIDSVVDWEGGTKNLTLVQPLETDIPDGTEVIFHSKDRPSGWFSIPVSFSSEGSQTISIRVNKSRVYALDSMPQVIYDATAPEIFLVSDNYYNSNANISFNVSDQISGVSTSTISASLTAPNGSVTQLTVYDDGGDQHHVDLSFGDVGEYELTISAKDNAGNLNETQYTLYFNNQLPTITRTSPTNFTTKNVTLSYVYNGYLDANCTLEINGVLNQTKQNINNDTEFKFTFNVTQSNYNTPYTANIEVTCTDLAGNSNSITHSLEASYLPKELIWSYKSSFPPEITWLIVNESPFMFYGITHLYNTTINFTATQGLSSPKRNSYTSLENNPLIDEGNVLNSQTKGNCYFLVNSSLNPSLSIGNGIRFEGHNRDNFTLYEITNIVDYFPNDKILYNITPCLDSNISAGEKFYVYNTSGKPIGWFNVSLPLFSGINNVSVVLSKYNERGYSTLNNIVVYDDASPEISYSIPKVCMPYPVFNITIKSYSPLNFSKSWITISNSTETLFSLNGQELEANTTLEIKDYKYVYTLIIDESLTGELPQGDYNLTIKVVSVFNKQATQELSFSKDSTIGQVTNLEPKTVEVSSPYFEFNWSALPDAHNVTYNYTLYESLSDFGNDFVPVLSNSTNDTNVIIYYPDAKYNHGYKLVVFAIDSCGNIGDPVNSSSSIILVDLTPPTNPTIELVPSENYTNNPSQIKVTWNFVDPESDNLTYEYCIADLDNNCFYGPKSTLNETLTITDTNLSLEHGKQYNIVVRAMNPSEIWSEKYFKTFTVDLVAPENSTISYNPGPLYYTDTITIDVSLGDDDLSGISKGEIYLMKANLTLLGTNLSCGHYDSGTLIKTVTTDASFSQNLTNGYCYKLKLRTYDKAGNYNDSFVEGDYFNGSIIVDFTKPTKVTVFDESFSTSSNTLFFNWTESQDNESGIKKYIYYLKDSEDSVIVSGETDPSTREVRLENLALSNGETYFLSVIAENYIGLQSDEAVSDGIVYLDRIPPEKAVILNVSGGNYSISNRFYDLSSNLNTTVHILAEDGSSCIFSDMNLGYTDLHKLGDCIPQGEDEFYCNLSTPEEGVYTYYIACKDAAGNKQSTEESLEITIVKTFNDPDYQMIKPELVNGNVFASERDEIRLNISSYSPIKSAEIILSNVTGDVLLSKNSTVEIISDGFYEANSSLDLTNITEDTLNLQINVTDAFNRSTVKNYILVIKRNKPSYLMYGFSQYYTKKQDLTLNISAYLFNNISINITNSSGQILFSFENNSNETVLEKRLVIPLNLTNSTWLEDEYTLNIFLFNNISKENVTDSFTFIVDNQAPVIKQPTGPTTTVFDDEPLNFSFDANENNQPQLARSGIKSAILYYNVSYNSEIKNYSKPFILGYFDSGVEGEIVVEGETSLPPGTFKPGSIINYSFTVLDNAGNKASTEIESFNISNRQPYFVTLNLTDEVYQLVKSYQIIEVDDPDLYQNISCNLASTYPSSISDNITVTTINETACRLEFLVNHTGYANLTITLSDGISSVNQSYNFTVNPTQDINLDMSKVHHLVEVKALFNETFISEGKYQSTTNITVPQDNTSLMFNYANVEITTEKRNYSDFDDLAMTFLNMPTSFVDSSELNLGLDKRFVPKNAYVIEFNKTMNYTISFNYSGIISNPKAVKIYKIAYDYDTDTVNYTDYVEITDYTVDTSKSSITFTVSNFSLFVLAEDSQYVEPSSTSSSSSSRSSSSGSSRRIIVTATCNDSIKNQDETDVDCGGSCGKCFNGKSCINDSDCFSGYCDPETKICMNKPSCNDGIKNQDETDVDCGGSCSKCSTGRTCNTDSDCLSNYCYDGICRIPTCNDGIKNQDETDVDCGGSCGKCSENKHCKSNYDCKSKNCVNGVCFAATCDDGIKNQDETDIDCGGSCKACPDTKVCNSNSDCLSRYCYNSICRTPTCNDGIKNQGEEGVDCGGPCTKECETTIQQPRPILSELYNYVLLFVILLVTVISLILIVLRKSGSNTKLSSQRKIKPKHKPQMNSVADKGSAELDKKAFDEKSTEDANMNLTLSENDRKIIISYIRALVKKSIKDGLNYQEIKSLLVEKGYSAPEFLAIAKEEYLDVLRKRIKEKISEFRNRGFSDDEIIENFKRLGFSEDEAKSFLE